MSTGANYDEPKDYERLKELIAKWALKTDQALTEFHLLIS